MKMRCTQKQEIGVPCGSDAGWAVKGLCGKSAKLFSYRLCE